MSTQFRIEKVLESPTVLNPNTLYIYKDSYGRLVFEQSNKTGTSTVKTYSTEEVLELVDAKISEAPILSGPRTLSLNEVGSYTIMNYDPTNDYDLALVADGIINRDRETITYKAPSSGKEAGFIVDTTIIRIELNNPSHVAAPTITSPEDGDTVPADITVTGTAFSMIGEVDTHVATDWQISTSETFATLLVFSENNAIDLTSWDVTSLPVNTTFYARIRYKGNVFGYSDWSEINDFTTPSTLIQKPSITAPIDGITLSGDTLNIAASAYTVIGGTGTHASTDWEISTDPAFATTVISSLANTINKTAITVSGFSLNQTHYIRVRYTTNTGVNSSWSNTVSVIAPSTFATAPDTPAITSPLTGASNLGPDVLITSSVFGVSSGTDTHTQSDWQVATDSGFTQITHQSLADTTNKTSFNTTGLNNNATYYVRARYTGAVSGVSAWSSVVVISTKTTYVSEPDQPAISSPIEAAVVGENLTVTSTAFSVASGTDTHTQSDWEIATDASFTQITHQSLADTVNKTTWSPVALTTGTSYYIRVRHYGLTAGVSQWSVTRLVSTPSTFATAPNTPTIDSPLTGTTDLGPNVTLVGSAFAVSSGTDTHTQSDWQVATNVGFTNIVFSALAETVNKVNFDVVGLSANTTYYARVRYYGSVAGVSSYSTTVSFTTLSTYEADPNTPFITSPASGATNVLAAPTITSSAFSVASGTDTHTQTDWEVATDTEFTALVFQSLANTTNKTSITITPNLTPNTAYYARVRQYGQTTGESAWSATSGFTTKSTFDVSPIAPSIISPANGATGQDSSILFTSSDFAVATGIDTHDVSDWQLSTSNVFDTIFKSSTNSASDKTTWTPTGLAINTTYYIRTRHRGVGANTFSAWSAPISVVTKTTFATAPNTPTRVSPAAGATNQSPFLTIQFSNFAVASGSDTHVSSTWEIATENTFTNIVETSVNDTTNLVTYQPTTLSLGTQYFYRVKYTGAITNDSAWSLNTNTFTTKVNAIDTPVPTSPAINATNQNKTVNIVSSAYANVYPDAHTSSDWEVSTDSGFTAIVHTSLSDTVNLTTWTTPNLTPNTLHYYRVRYRDLTGRVSQYSTGRSFTTATSFISTPTVTTPTNAQVLAIPEVNITTSAFVSNSGLTHVSTDWELSTVSNFATTVATSVADTVNLTTWFVNGLVENTTYYLRVRYNSAEDTSPWSLTRIFSTAFYIVQPVITSPINNVINMGQTVSVTSSAFDSTLAGDTHVSSDWQVASNSGFSNIAQNNPNDAVNLTSWTTGNLSPGTAYWVRVRYTGSV